MEKGLQASFITNAFLVASFGGAVFLNCEGIKAAHTRRPSDKELRHPTHGPVNVPCYEADPVAPLR